MASGGASGGAGGGGVGSGHATSSAATATPAAALAAAAAASTMSTTAAAAASSNAAVGKDGKEVKERDRRFKPLYDALEQGNFRGVVKLSEKKDIAQLPLTKVCMHVICYMESIMAPLAVSYRMT